MYYLNCNSAQVMSYFTDHIAALLSDLETRAEKIERLSLILKKINQAPLKSGMRSDPRGATLKEYLNNYILEESDYQEKLYQLSGDSYNRASEPDLRRFKMKFETSVSQLAYLLRILIESKIILNSNLTRTLNFLVQFVITKRSGTVSYGSFRPSINSVEKGSKESVRAMLLRMINHTDWN